MWRYIWSKIFGQWKVSKLPDVDPAAKLKTAIGLALANKDWTSLPDGTTFCNDFCQQVLQSFGCSELNGMLADQMEDRILSDISLAGESIGRWQELTSQGAVDKAKAGYCVLGSAEAHPHGHVVIIAPEDMDYSPTWKINVPMCASIIGYNKGPNRIVRVSEAYLEANKPRYFVWLG